MRAHAAWRGGAPSDESSPGAHLSRTRTLGAWGSHPRLHASTVTGSRRAAKRATPFSIRCRRAPPRPRCASLLRCGIANSGALIAASARTHTPRVQEPATAPTARRVGAPRVWDDQPRPPRETPERYDMNETTTRRAPLHRRLTCRSACGARRRTAATPPAASSRRPTPCGRSRGRPCTRACPCSSGSRRRAGGRRSPSAAR